MYLRGEGRMFSYVLVGALARTCAACCSCTSNRSYTRLAISVSWGWRATLKLLTNSFGHTRECRDELQSFLKSMTEKLSANMRAPHGPGCTPWRRGMGDPLLRPR